MRKILVLGGTSFIGRGLVEALLTSPENHVTLFNRGKSNPNLFSGVNLICGDRNTSDVKKIARQEWDYIIDVSCYYPNSLENILRHVKPNLKRYIFISTASVYNNERCKEVLRTEQAPLLTCKADEKINKEPSSYGKRKAECERILEQSGICYSILRPALVYGQYDPTDRFYYWLYQCKTHSQLLLPKGGTQFFSTTYVKDLIEGILQLLSEEERARVYNAVSTPQTSIASIIKESQQLLGVSPQLLTVNDSLICQHEIQEWVDFPLWLNNDYHTYNNELFVSLIGAHKTPFTKSIQDTIHYFSDLEWPTPQFGMDESEKQELLNSI